MSDRDYTVEIGEHQMAILLLKVLKKKEKINEPTYNEVLKVYLKKFREVA